MSATPITELTLSTSRLDRLEQAGIETIQELKAILQRTGALAERVKGAGTEFESIVRNAVVEYETREITTPSAKQTDPFQVDQKSKYETSENRTESQLELSTRFFWVGCAFSAFALIFIAIGFGLGDLSGHQREILRFVCAMFSGFGAASFTGRLELMGSLHIPKTPARLGVSGGAGFAVFVLVFFWLFPAAKEQPNVSTIVRLRFDSYGDDIYRSCRLFYVRADLSDPKQPPLEATGQLGVVRIPDLSPKQVKITAVECQGFDFKGVQNSNENGADFIAWMVPNSEFSDSIKPSNPLSLMNGPPTPRTYAEIVDQELPPKEVNLTCMNETNSTLKILLFHYVDENVTEKPSDFAYDGWLGLPFCRKDETIFYSSFGWKPGYYLVFASKNAEPAELIYHGSLYATSEPSLTFRLNNLGDFETKEVLKRKGKSK